jgi:ankyrin repeat protein
MGNAASDQEGEDAPRSARHAGKQSRDGAIKPAFDPTAVAPRSGDALPELTPRAKRQAEQERRRREEIRMEEAEMKADEDYEEKFLVHSAAHEGVPSALSSAVESNPNFNPYDDSLRTPLYYCTASDNIECVRILLEKRPDIMNLGDEEGDTALHISSYYGHTDILRLLLQYKAEINLPNKKGLLH